MTDFTPKVKAAYQYLNVGTWVVYYTGIDLTDYANDVKSFERKLEVFRADNNQLITSKTLAKDEFKINLLFRDGQYNTDPILNDLPIRVVLTLTRDGQTKIAEDIIDFVSVDQNAAPASIYLSLLSDGFKISDSNSYPIFNNKAQDDFSRYVVVSRRPTDESSVNKIEYVKELVNGVSSIDFDYFNEYVVEFDVLWINKVTNQLYVAHSGNYATNNPLLTSLYNAGGKYVGSAGKDPLASEDLAPNMGVIDPSNPEQPTSGTVLRDVVEPLRIAVRAKLLSTSVPIYDAFVPDSAPDSFIVIKDINEADDSLKSVFNGDVHVTLDIVTRFPQGSGTSSKRDQLTGQVYEKLIPNTVKIDHFHILNAVRTLSRPIDEDSNQYKILRKIIIIKYKIQQLN
ncbi:hypothetical protein G7074_18185 [Pedobacter sp. HDW13]|uniref:hypothetical protein n=1 Tax=Pedobacter sp. HDW13 TaxID=2714940 RepID=UPI0014096793|nr:hypothetical protein [Pedobacter sp. HDW13]QIL41024.1 hypothetical protein G7074_18185 [Pedobacter sp. HDW13]